MTSAWRTRTSSSGGTLVLMAATPAPEPTYSSTCSALFLRARAMLSASYSSAHTTSVSPDDQAGEARLGVGQGPQHDAVEVGLALVPVVGVALQHHAVAGRP